MRVLLTGYNGFVAGSALAQVPADWEVHGIARSPVPAPAAHAGSAEKIFFHQADLLDQAGLKKLVREIRPDAILHAAAIANIDFCENHRDLAEDMNVGVTAHLAELAAETGAKLVFCSTDTVFDGKKGRYTEDDAPHAVNFYADTKCRAERIVLSAGAHHVVARLALVMGWPVLGRGNSFVADLVEKLSKGETGSFAENEYRTPIDVLTLGAALNELTASSFGGILHLAGNTRLNRYDLALRIAACAGYSSAAIRAVNSNALAGRAPRPDDASLNNARARKLLRTPMLGVDEGLALSFSRHEQTKQANRP